MTRRVSFAFSLILTACCLFLAPHIAIGGSISGIVYQDGGGTLADVRVCAESEKCWDGQHYGCTETDANGAYTLNGIPLNETVYLNAGGQGYVEENYDAQNGTFNCRLAVGVKEAATGIDFSLAKGKFISGTVVDANSTNPIEGIWVSADLFDNHGNWFFGTGTETDVHGDYTISGLPDGNYKVRADGPDFGYLRQYYNSTNHWDQAQLVAPNATGINFSLDPAGSITGTVSDDSGTPLSGIDVCAESEKCWDGQHYGCTETDANGAYTLNGIPLDTTVYLDAGGQGYVEENYDAQNGTFNCRQAVGVEEAATGIDFSLEKGKFISGTVVDANSTNPIEDLWVSADLFDNHGNWFFGTGTETDVNGDYTISGLPDGNYKVRADGPDLGYLRQYYNSTNHWDQAQLVAPNATGINFSLDPAGNITGTVYNATGETPLSGIDVCAQSETCWNGLDYGCTQTDENGQYRLNGILPGGTVYLNARGRQFVQEHYNEAGGTIDCNHALGVTEGENDEGIDFYLTQGGSISGRVTDAQGDPIANLWVSADLHDQNGNWLYGRGDETSSDGTYTITGLPEGDYKVRAEGEDHGFVDYYYNNRMYWDQADLVPVVPGEDEPSIIDFSFGAFPIQGSVMSYQTSEGDKTYLDIYIGTHGYDGDLQSCVDSISITGPNGLSLTKNDLDYWFEPYVNGGGFRTFRNGSPAEGEYTFSVLYTNGIEFNATDYQGEIKQIPIPDQDEMSPAPGTTVNTLTPTFSWGAVSVSDTDLYYRLQIRNSQGDTIFASGREEGMLSLTVPVDILEGGQSYKWRVRVTDSSNWVEVDNRSQTDWIPLTISETPTTSPAPPVIDLDYWGAVNYMTQDGHGLSSWLKIVDQDGISSDGSSHTVTVTMPDGTVRNLGYNYHENTNTAIYEDWDWRGSEPPQAGTYTFNVTDAGGNTFSITDELNINSDLGVPDDSSFTPVNGEAVSDTTPTFTWDPVPGAIRHRVRIYSGDNSRTVWNGYLGNSTSYTVPPGILEPFTDYRYRIEARSEHSPLDTDNNAKSPASWENIRFSTGSRVDAPYIEFTSTGASTLNSDETPPYAEYFIKVHDAQGVPDTIEKVEVLTPDNIIVPLFLYSTASSTSAYYIGQSYGLPQAGDYTFTVTDENGNTSTRTEHLDVDPIEYPAAGSLSLTDQGDSYRLDWDDVAGAAFYRLEIYDIHQNRIKTFATTHSEYTVPYGFLKSGALYRYRITTWGKFFDQDIDNWSVIPWFYSRRPSLVHEPVTGSSTPMISLNQDASGVSVLHHPDPATDASSYWLVFNVSVSDADGFPENGLKVTATDPNGQETSLNLHTLQNATSATFKGQLVYADISNIPQGQYTFTATDAGGRSATLHDSLTINQLPLPTNLSPASGAVISGTSPFIDWDDVDGADGYRVKIYSGWDKQEYTSEYLNESVYTVPYGILETDKVYSYQVKAFQEHYPDNDYDNLSTSQMMPCIRPYFTCEYDAQADTDGDGIPDIQEDANGNGIVDASETDPNDPDTDNDGLEDGTELDAGTDPLDMDTDDDGVPDGLEDVNQNGIVDSGEETDPNNIDSDGDGIQDGTELGYTLDDNSVSETYTDTNIFQPDLDPTTTTDPLNSDTDGDGVNDGVEDSNFNGRVDVDLDETDPNSRQNKAMPWLMLLLDD